ncbi:AGAP000791-PA [Anopheles gambiae str. PEST]|uniref:AGAP000791-PA n=2 Tax=gambiae species complex TaxID=44542 RepID=Q7QE72_ANOGA|nr:BTB/POZ domain-containing protein 17 [Anopheles coluzzii]XP_311333.5 BTB/POZ domain-containing protein 17 [Anopheles gambiae]EAA06951.5 AGAP000791-PA [Anopheles gambiae str. PEST]
MEVELESERVFQPDCSDMGLKTLYNTNSVLRKIANLYAERLMSDVTLVVGENRYPAHRIILCASSDVFQVMLMNATWREFGDAVITLQEEERCQGVFPQFLRYMYVGKMTISVDTAVYILKLADKYNIHDLVQICINYMKLHLNKATAKGHFVEWLHNALQICPGRKDLISMLENYLKWNLERIVSYPGWEQLSPGLMNWLLQQNDLVVRSEFRLYELVEVWFRYQRAQIEGRCEMREQDRESAINKLIHGVLVHIRFAMMSLPQLANVLMSGASVRMLKEFYVGRVADGMNFHSHHLEIVGAIRASEMGELQFTPRLYSSDLWSLEIAVDYFHRVEKYSSVASVFFTPTSFSDVDEESNGWDVEFFPLGVRYKPAQLIGIYSAATNREIPECIIRTVRLRITSQSAMRTECRYMVGVLICGMMNDEEYVRHCHVRVAYFSSDHRVLNIDNLIPIGELQMGTRKYSQYMVGEEQNTIRIKVVIVPLNRFSNVFAPPSE